jgi:hypothetical protein
MLAADKLTFPTHNSPSKVRIVIVLLSVSSLMPTSLSRDFKIKTVFYCEMLKVSVNSDNGRAVRLDNSRWLRRNTLCVLVNVRILSITFGWDGPPKKLPHAATAARYAE